MAVKLSYIPAQKRVRVVFSKEDCDDDKKPPADLEIRAVSKLDTETSKGNIHFYELHMDRLKTIWAKVRKSKENDETMIAVTIATACSEFPQVKIVAIKEKNDGTIASISITATKEEVEKWRIDEFCLFIQKSLREQNSKKSANPAQLQSFYYRACAGQVISQEDIKTVPALDFRSDDFEYIDLVTDPTTFEISLIVRDVKDIVDNHEIGKVLKAVVFRSEQISVKHKMHFEVLTDEIVRRLRSANRGPERYGLDLPLVLLATRNTINPIKPEVKYTKTTQPVNEMTEIAVNEDVEILKKFIEIAFTDDKLSATISEWKTEMFEQEINLNLENVQIFLEESGIKFGLIDTAASQIVSLYETKGEGENLAIAKGKPATAGKGPYVWASYKHRDISELSDEMDFRALQQRFAVKMGQLVAEILYKTVPTEGMTVLGDKIPPAAGEPLEVDIGDGIKSADGIKFFATKDGIPDVSATAVALTSDLIHKGNINLSSGDIDFDGCVQIVGNIEEGSRVTVSGDLKVLGMIQGGIVTVKGMLTVEGGIMGDYRSRVTTGGDIFADFFSNATIICGGSVITPKNIMSCTVSAEDNITLTGSEQSLIAGGSIECGKSITTAYLGRSDGSVTFVKAGCDIHNENRYLRDSKKLEDIKGLLEREKKTLKEYKMKREEQMTGKTTAIKETLEKRVETCKRIIEALTNRAAASKEKLSHNKEARIMVSETLSKNCRITVAGTKVGIPEDVAGVGISATRIQGSFVVPIEHFEKEG